MNEIETKLARARTKLIMDKPFLGALVLRLPMRAAEPKWCPTSATDARHFFYNPDYIEALKLEQVQFVLAHEALHCALSHFARRQHRNQFRWDLACDYAINPLLLNDGLMPPPGVWVEESYEGLTAEEIYPMIDENNADEPMDRHVYDGEQEGGSDGEGSSSNEGQSEPKEELGGARQPPPLCDSERQNLDVQWQQRLAGAAQQALQAGKLGGAMARMVDHLLQPQLPWRMLLARYMTTMARDDYSYMRPSRREGAAIFPSLRSAQLEIVVALDTSGSVSDDEIAQCVAEINALKGQMRARITLLACDAKLADDGPWVYEPWEDFSAPHEFTGGGGTSFKPVFDYVESHIQQHDLLVYFTDAVGDFPEKMPPYPVIWLVKGKGKVPWGQRIQLN
ncbi:MAG: VWA-like domain-containing protein [Pseudomonadota bacterium]